jgi:hypothetical protein
MTSCCYAVDCVRVLFGVVLVHLQRCSGHETESFACLQRAKKACSVNYTKANRESGGKELESSNRLRQKQPPHDRLRSQPRRSHDQSRTLHRILVLSTFNEGRWFKIRTTKLTDQASRVTNLTRKREKKGSPPVSMKRCAIC